MPSHHPAVVIRFQALNTQAAAARLGVSTDMLRRWRRDGGGPRYIRLDSGVCLYMLADLQKFLEARAVEPEPTEAA